MEERAAYGGLYRHQKCLNKYNIHNKNIQNRFNTVYQTARTDIISLEELRLIEKTTSGKKKLIYYRSGMFDERVRKLTQ